MPGPRLKTLSMPRRLQRMTGRTVHVPIGGPRRQGFPAGPLSGENEVVELDLPLGGGGADDEGPADLAAVAVIARPEADGEEIPSSTLRSEGRCRP